MCINGRLFIILLLGMIQFPIMSWRVIGAELEPEISGSAKLSADVATERPISLHFQDIPVRSVLQILADYNGFNLVTSDSVTGNITLRLDDVPWQQALDTILNIKALASRRHGNILLIAPAAELAAQDTALLQAKQQAAKLAPLHTRYIRLNYANADELAELLKQSATQLLSGRGSVAVDARTNTLLVRDTAAAQTAIQHMVNALDQAVRQVTIKSRVVTVNDSLSDELGIRWGYTQQSGVFASSGSLTATDNLANGTSAALADRLNVDLPVADSAGSIAFHLARLADDKLLDLELSALEEESKGEIIASPQLTTVDKKPAYIEQGMEIPYEESSSSGATSVTFKKAVLSLRVTPSITVDGQIMLDLVITQDTQGESVPTANGGNAVAIDTQEIGTQVLVNNGETIVLGGIYQHETINTIKKVPVLGDLPGLGWLFRSKRESQQKREVLIFVTPKIATKDI